MIPVTAVIPTIGRTETLPAVLTSLVFQAHKINEIILLDEARSTVLESYAVNQALDALALQGAGVKILRSRRRKGIGAARLRLVEEAKNNAVLMVDDDVVLSPSCVSNLLERFIVEGTNWVVPTCTLVSAALEVEGYIDHVVNPKDLDVRLWTEKHDWFIPYFKYNTPVICPISVSGTQCILVDKKVFLEQCQNLPVIGNLPREDTYLTTVMNGGWFTSKAECLHYEHPSQVDRGNWDTTSFYRIHDAIIRDPEGFLEFMRKEGSDFKKNLSELANKDSAGE